MLGEDANDIGRIWQKLVWAGALVGRSGLSTQAIAAIDIALWDLKARRAGVSLAKLIGAYRDEVPCYNTPGGFFSSSIDEVVANARASLTAGIGGIKIKVGHPDPAVARPCAALRDGVARASRGYLSERGVGGALRLAGAALRGTAPDSLGVDRRA